MMQMKRNHGVLIGVIIGFIGAFAAGPFWIGTNANAQFPQKRSEPKAVYMIAKQSALAAAAGGGPAAAMVDPDFYVLYDDGTIKKTNARGF